MKLVDMKVNSYLELLRSSAPAPGGGSVSALAGAQGLALILMVADLTIGKEKYADYQAICLEAKVKALPLYKALVMGIDKDTEAFNVVAGAYKMPKNSDEEKAVRSEAIAKGTILATEVPFETMEQGYDGLKLIEGMVGNSNPNASSDLGVAAINLSTCIQGAWLNVLINLPGIKDEVMVNKFKTEGERIFNESKKLAENLYEAVRISLI
ncbi:MAG: cyclodeaminase/cyclohydrolase family protein [Peptostreptococcaceae bacterium]|nr:cyclodeaminase/cyclohydrolase family protein [Peptostreptococcaceae bacterium]